MTTSFCITVIMTLIPTISIDLYGTEVRQISPTRVNQQIDTLPKEIWKDIVSYIELNSTQDIVNFKLSSTATRILEGHSIAKNFRYALCLENDAMMENALEVIKTGNSMVIDYIKEDIVNIVKGSNDQSNNKGLWQQEKYQKKMLWLCALPAFKLWANKRMSYPLFNAHYNFITVCYCFLEGCTNHDITTMMGNYLLESGLLALSDSVIGDISDHQQKNVFNVLHYACNTHNVSLVQLLIKKGAAVNAVDNCNNTPLHYCARRVSEYATDVARLLIQHGADIHIKNNDGHKPLSYALFNSNRDLLNCIINAPSQRNI